MMRRFLVALICFLGAACGGSDAVEAPPSPTALTDDAVGYYCGMTLSEHLGPKAQIFVEGGSKPFWFAQVRDAVQFIRSPEEIFHPVVFYVTDMSGAVDGDPPQPLNWIEANAAWFVIDGNIAGGMGAPETIPFSSEGMARNYAAQNGGRVLRLADIPDEYILAPYEPMMEEMKDMDHGAAN